MLLFKDFLSRKCGLENEFSEFSEVPMRVFLDGKEQDSLPYPKKLIDSSSKKELKKFLSNFRKKQNNEEASAGLSLEIRFGSDFGTLFLYRNNALLETLLMYFK